MVVSAVCTNLFPRHRDAIPGPSHVQMQTPSSRTWDPPTSKFHTKPGGTLRLVLRWILGLLCGWQLCSPTGSGHVEEEAIRGECQNVPSSISLRRAGGFPPQVKGSMGGGQNYKAQYGLLGQEHGLG